MRAAGERPASSSRLALVVVAAIVVLAAIIRLRTLGDVVAHGDEQFYLLVGDQMLNHRALPYVDIWDRKPVGLFLLFAGIRLLGGDGIGEYQLVATAVAAGTAVLIALWVNRVSGVIAALCAGLLYLAILQTHLGFGGQAEVFVNLFVVGAGWLVHGLLRDHYAGHAPPARALLVYGAIAMALIGLALQIKPTALFPGLWLGITLLWIGFRARLSFPQLGGGAALWIGAALLPTVIVLLWYAGIGHLQDYIYANITSIAEKGSDGRDDEIKRSIGVVLRLGLPFGVAVALLAFDGWRQRMSPERLASLLFLLGWFASGVVAFFAVKAAYPHYAMIMAPMGCLLVGYAAGLRRIGWIMVAVALLMSGRLLLNDLDRVARNAEIAPQIEAMADAIRPELGDGCLYVYHGPHILYTLTNSCVPTRFAFPNHLSTQPEASGLGIDPAIEVARILRTRPPVIVDGENSFHPPNKATQAILYRVLAADYVKFAQVRIGGGEPLATAYRLKPQVR